MISIIDKLVYWLEILLIANEELKRDNEKLKRVIEAYGQTDDWW